jgi:hypothetical protein
MIEIHSTYSDIDPEQWNDLVLKSDTASFFQSPVCFNFYSFLSFLKPFVFGVSEENILKAVVCGYCISDGNSLKRYFSRRAIIPGGVLIDNDTSNETIQQLLTYVTQKLSKESIYIEIRNYNDYSAFQNGFISAGFTYYPHLNFQVATNDVDSALMQLNSTKRRDVRLSRKEGAEWVETTDMDDVSAYYTILQELYKTRIKTPLFPLEFFQKLVSGSFGKLLVIKYNDTVIGGSVCVLLPGKTVYEWFVCGLDSRYKNVFPSTVATWAGIEYAASHGYTCFDMMGAGKPDEGYGVREFKSKFGGKLVEHGRYLYVCKPLLYHLGKKVVQILKKK